MPDEKFKRGVWVAWMSLLVAPISIEVSAFGSCGPSHLQALELIVLAGVGIAVAIVSWVWMFDGWHGMARLKRLVVVVSTIPTMLVFAFAILLVVIAMQSL